MPYASFEQFTQAIASGQHLGSFPTDTVPALAAQPAAASLIYTAKQRSFDKPLILMAGEIDQLQDYIQGSPAEKALWRSVMQEYWPGALTLVLPASDLVPAAMNPNSPPNSPRTIGVRVPNHNLARTILRQTGALATTSANRSGEAALLEMPQILQTFPEVYQLSDAALQELGIAPSQLIASGQPSTVVKWAGQDLTGQDLTGQHWQVLRQGSVILPDNLLQPGPRSAQDR
jgi:L-threonylcarbamoyladenylate synthase